jgi:hypothetical protein
MNPIKWFNQALMGARYVDVIVLDDVSGSREVVRHNPYVPMYVKGALNPAWVLSKKELYKLKLRDGYRTMGKIRIHFVKGLSDPIGFSVADKHEKEDSAEAWALAMDDKVMKVSLQPPTRDHDTMWMVFCMIGIFLAFIIGYNLPAISHVLMNLGGNATSTTTPPIYTPHG